MYQSIAIKKDHGRIISAFVLEFVISIVSHNYYTQERMIKWGSRAHAILHVSVILPY